MAYYHTCPDCGANLDPGEKCDCEKEGKSREGFYGDVVIRPGKTGQFHFHHGWQGAGGGLSRWG